MKTVEQRWQQLQSKLGTYQISDNRMTGKFEQQAKAKGGKIFTGGSNYAGVVNRGDGCHR